MKLQQHVKVLWGLLFSSAGMVGTAAGGLEVEHLEYTFEAFLRHHNKHYSDRSEYDMRKGIFQARLEEIVEHNKDKSNSYRKGINRYADWTPAELKAMLGYKYTPTLRSAANVTHLFGDAKLPDAVDWREKNVLTPVKDQGMCGSCWTFGATESLESALALQTGKLVELSEQTYVSCATNLNHCGGTGGCEGGTVDIVYDYAKKHGMFLESQYRYEARNDACRLDDSSSSLQAVAILQDYVDLPENDYKATMQAVARQPIPVNVDASSFAFYSSGVFDETHCGTDINHVVQLVGYGTDADSGDDYWIIRNSWAEWWGEQGYMRIRRSDACAMDTRPQDGTGCTGGPSEVKVCGSCGILYQNSYPTNVKLTEYGRMLLQPEKETTATF